MPNTNPRGAFVWHELLTTDTKAAISYYGRVVGWKSQAWENDPSYTLFVAKSGPAAGCMLLPEEAKAMGSPPNWMSYIGTLDVDETARQAEQLGGRVLRAPSDVPNTGRFAVLQDPQGAVFGAYTSASESNVSDTAALGEFSWHELATDDVDEAFEFYRALFGWVKTTAMDMGENGVYQMFGRGGAPLGGIYRRPPSMPAPPHWLPYAMVPDSKRAAETLTSLGGKIINGPMEVPGGDWIVMGMDPQGAAFAVHSRMQARMAATPKLKVVAKKAPKKAAKKKPAKKAAKKKPAKKAAKKAPKKAARRRKVTKRPARKAPKRSTRKVAKRPARKTARKPAKKKAARKKAARRPARGRKRAAAKRGRPKKRK